MNKVQGPFPNAREIARFERTLPKDLKSGTRAKIKNKPRRVGITNTPVKSHTSLDQVIAINEVRRNPIWYLN